MPAPGGQWNAGFRGAVSLAAALAVPDTIASGMPFPDRDMIIFVRPESSLSPWCFRGCSCRTRFAGLGCPVTPVEQERHPAEILATEEALAALPQLAAGLGTDTEVADRLRREYEKDLRVVRASSTGDAPPIRR